MTKHPFWITPQLFHLAEHCPKIIWTAIHHQIKATPFYTDFFAEEKPYIINQINHNLSDITTLSRSLDVDSRAEKTQALLSQNKSIAHGAIRWERYEASIDILKHINNQWELTYIQPNLKPTKHDYINMAFTAYLLHQNHIPLAKITFTFVNRNYKRNLDLDLTKLLRHINVTPKVNRLIPAIASKLTEFLSIISRPTPPHKPFGLPCLKPTECQFLHQCWPNLRHQSIVSISGISKQQKVKFIQKEITSLHELSLHMTLNKTQAIQVACELDNQVHIQKEAIHTFLNTLSFPLYFMDFEVAQFSVPPFSGLKPLHQVPFQYSIHYINHINDTPKHIEFLHNEKTNPEPEFTQSLINDIPNNVPIIVFNQNLEKIILKQLANQSPQYKPQLMALSSQLRDIAPLFLNNAYYHPSMKGKFSLKEIYAAIAPNEPQFNSLTIKNGESANTGYKQYLYETNPDKKSQILKHLHHYCQLDTYAMVKVIQQLHKLV